MWQGARGSYLCEDISMRLERMGMGMVKGMVVSVWGVVRTEMELGPHSCHA